MSKDARFVRSKNKYGFARYILGSEWDTKNTPDSSPGFALNHNRFLRVSRLPYKTIAVR